MTAPSVFLDACRRRPTAFTPIWLMRQAGRYMAEYRNLRERWGFLELCKNPQAAADVTLQPAERLGVDAAILFADILLVLEPLGVGLEFTRGEGPHIHRPLRSAADVERLPPVAVDDAVGFVFETVRLARKALAEAVVRNDQDADHRGSRNRSFAWGIGWSRAPARSSMACASARTGCR